MKKTAASSSQPQRERIQSEDYFSSEEYPSNSISTYSNMAPPTSSSRDSPSPCGICKKLVKQGDAAVECNFCGFYIHGKCLKQKLTKAETDSTVANSASFWFKCDTWLERKVKENDGKCFDQKHQTLLVEIKKQMVELKEENKKQMDELKEEYKKQMDELKEENVKLKQENLRLQQRMEELEHKSAKLINFDVIFEAMDEFHQRRDKKNNMVFHYLCPDNDSKADDLEIAQNLANDSGGEGVHVTEKGLPHWGSP